MFGNRKINLFAEIRIDTFLNEKEREIQNKIERYNDTILSSVNLQDEIKSLIESVNLNVPKLQKEKTKSIITTEKRTGMQLPEGTRFEMGKKYDIEFVNYTIYFKGNGDFFKCIPSTGRNYQPLRIEKHNNSIILKMTNWLNGISGNNEVIEHLKTEFLKQIEKMETTLNQLETDIESYKPILEKRIQSELGKLIEQVKIKNESNDKLNPFS